MLAIIMKFLTYLSEINNIDSFDINSNMILL